MSPQLSAEQWTRYWSAGSTTSFLGRFDQNYDGEIKAFWQAGFNALPPQANIVDLGAGNGALSILAAEYSAGADKAFTVTAVDYAEIDPQDRVVGKLPADLRQRIRLLSGTRMEHTGLEAGQFDAAISQFGFEYGDVEQTVAEASRLLKPQAARLMLIMHHCDSAVIRQAREGLQQVDTCDASGLHDILRQLLHTVDQLKQQGKDPAEDSAAEALRHAANTVTESLHQAMDDYRDPAHLNFFLSNSMAVFGPQMSAASSTDKSAYLASLQEEAVLYRQRMLDLVHAARSPQDIATLHKLLEERGFAIELSENFLFEDTFFGYALQAAR